MSACVFFKRYLLLGLNFEKPAFPMGPEFQVPAYNPVVAGSEYAYKVRRQANQYWISIVSSIRQATNLVQINADGVKVAANYVRLLALI